MTTLITIGCLTMTPEQLDRALKEEMTVSQALKMIEEDKDGESPVVGDVENDSTMTTGDGEDSER